MERRDFLLTTATAAAASFPPGMSMEAKAEAVEAMAMQSLDARAREQLDADVGVARPWLAYPELPQPHPMATVSGKPVNPSASRMMMGSDPRLPPMPEKPTLVDFFRQRWLPASHLLQSANLALKNGHDEKVILACLLHDVSNGALVRTDHGYWGAQLVEPYVDEEVSWAIRAHQALRFFPDESVGYEYPQSYIRLFGEDYTPSDYILQGLRRGQGAQVLHDGAVDLRKRPLLFRSRRSRRVRHVHRHHRPQLPPAGRRPRFRQQSRRPHVADDDLAE